MQNVFELRDTKSAKRATFCLPPKCGTTSWQRALSYQIVNHKEDYLVPESAVELLKRHKEVRVFKLRYSEFLRHVIQNLNPSKEHPPILLANLTTLWIIFKSMASPDLQERLFD